MLDFGCRTNLNLYHIRLTVLVKNIIIFLEYSDDYSEPQVLNTPSEELNGGVGQVTDPRDLYDNYYGNDYLKSWAFPARRLRSASFAHVLRV